MTSRDGETPQTRNTNSIRRLNELIRGGHIMEDDKRTESLDQTLRQLGCGGWVAKYLHGRSEMKNDNLERIEALERELGATTQQLLRMGNGVVTSLTERIEKLEKEARTGGELFGSLTHRIEMLECLQVPKEGS